MNSSLFRGNAPLAKLVASLFQEPKDVLDPDSVLPEGHMKDIDPWKIIQNKFENFEEQRLGGDRDPGYYGWCRKKRYREQILDPNNDTGLQRTVQEVADRYIKRST